MKIFTSILFLLSTSFAYAQQSAPPPSVGANGTSQTPTDNSGIGLSGTTSSGPGSSSQGANQTAGNEKGLDTAVGLVSAAGGAAMMIKGCRPGGAIWLCAVGAGLVGSSAGDFSKAGSRDQNIDQTTGAGGSAPPTAPDSGTMQLPNEFQPYLDAANAAAAQTGKSLGQLASDGQAMIDSGKPLPDMPQDVKDAVDKAIKDARSKYKVIAVGTEGGGGGMHKMNSPGGLNLNDLLSGLNANRDIASIDGLQKRLGTDPIGVAGDNIFKQVSRRYQTKTYLNIPPSRGPNQVH